MSRRGGGFTIVELLIAMTVMTTCGAALLSLVIAGQRIAQAQPEAADQQQRARAAIETLGGALTRTGAGMERGAHAGPLVQYFAPMTASADGGLTLWSVSGRGAQAALGSALAAGDVVAAIDADGSCPAGQATCAFAANTTAIVFDASGCHDAVRIETVSPAVLTLAPATRACAYAAGAAIAEGEVRTFRVDPASRQLIRRDEATGSSAPVLDNVAGMTLESFDGNRRVRVTLRFVSALLQVPDLVFAIDAAPPNLRGA